MLNSVALKPGTWGQGSLRPDAPRICAWNIPYLFICRIVIVTLE